MMVRYQQGGTVAVVGGGLAGLSAACALAEAGFRVTLFERRPFLGGRASSYQHPGTGETVDNCQHVLLGCCTNLLDFFRRIGVADKLRWYDELTFVEPGGRRSQVSPSFLPAPFHTAPSFLWASSLELKDKLAIASVMALLIEGLPEDTAEDFLSWLRRHRQTENAIRRFWKVVLVSALNEELDRISVRYAAQVFRESFLKSPEGARMGVPMVPLTELYAPAGEYLRARGGEVVLRAAVDSVSAGVEGVRLRMAGGEQAFDFAVSAVPFDVLHSILPDAGSVAGLRQSLARFETSPITGIHLWFDRPVVDLDHAVLLDRTIQWMFHKSRLLDRPSDGGSYIELVVSSSRSLLEMRRNAVVELALREMQEFFPEVAAARLVKSTVIKEVHATYSALPQSELYRPGPVTPWPRLLLAGDWTATGWPATMEGAVRSGYRAAEALAQMAGRPQGFLAPDMPATGFMRILSNLPLKVVTSIDALNR